MCAPSPRSGGERIQGEGLLFRREFLPVFTLQAGYRCLQQGIVRAQTPPLTFDPLPARAGRGSRHRDPLIERNHFCRRFPSMRPMLSMKGPAPPTLPLLATPSNEGVSRNLTPLHQLVCPKPSRSLFLSPKFAAAGLWHVPRQQDYNPPPYYLLHQCLGGVCESQ